MAALVVDAIKKWRAGTLAKDDTTIKRWKEWGTEWQKIAESRGRSLDLYRAAYTALWAEYVRTGGDREKFSVDPLAEKFPDRGSKGNSREGRSR